MGRVVTLSFGSWLGNKEREYKKLLTAAIDKHMINNRKIDIQWDFRFLFLLESWNEMPVQSPNSKIKYPKDVFFSIAKLSTREI